jgi:uncharacterized protein
MNPRLLCGEQGRKRNCDKARLMMFIDIRELEAQRLEFDQEFKPGVIALGEEAKQVQPLRARGHAELVQEHQAGAKPVEDIRLVAGFTTSIEVACARCLEPVRFDLDREFDLLYRPQGVEAGHEELSITDAEAEIGYYSGGGLLLEDVLREQVLLSLPLKALCQEQCKGLCPQCGKNWNEGPCSCTAQPVNPRWPALQDLKSKLQ